MPKRNVTIHKPMLPPLTATNSSDDERASVIEPTNIQPALNLAAKKMAITRPTEKPTQNVAVTPVAVLALPYPICSTYVWIQLAKPTSNATYTKKNRPTTSSWPRRTDAPCSPSCV